MTNKIPPQLTPDDASHLNTLLNHLKTQRNFDFSQYRKSYLYRRIYSRILHTKNKSLKAYMDYLFTHPEEYPQLIDALTINVTEFFRDKEVFQFIAQEVVPEIIKTNFDSEEKKLKKKIFVWSAGASCGQEPYSIAMIFVKIFTEKKIPLDMVKILATDIDKDSLEKAKAAVYELKEIENVPPIYRKYFIIDDAKKEARIDNKIKNLVSFAKNDLVLDPPPHCRDLILCRNVFIYFSKDLQLAIMEKMAKALNKRGFLILGRVETMFNLPESLSVFNNLHKVFRKI